MPKIMFDEPLELAWMRPWRFARLTALLTAVLTFVGCLGVGVGAPSALGILVGEGLAKRELLIELPEAGGNRILDLEIVGTNEILFLTSERVLAHSPDASGLVEKAKFSSNDHIFPGAIVAPRDGEEPGYIGVESSGSCLLLLSPTGRRERCIPGNAAGQITAADLSGDGLREILSTTPDQKGMAAYDLFGRRLWTHDAMGYVVAMGVLAGKDSAPEPILHLYPGREGRAGGTYQRLDAYGRLLQEWNGPVVGGLEPIIWSDGTAAFLTLETDALVAYSRTGEQLMLTGVPGAGKFRELRSIELRGGVRVVLARGGGYWPYHLLVILDRSGKLIYHESDVGRAYGLVAGVSGSGIFYASIENRVWRYSLP